ncbi:ABC transporter ATP-binding protein [Burkholderia oklahomensis]|uniref:ABC transporter ATP-binding protein n=1 Tax=Burkholderia oklahomensis TaxID=342113 RepID=UPI002653F081|nr:ABC transporter ATP-binding protein [Burkholderia oklahomensis]MDN7670991.1 ABC transporter ATP-binding protein [Burkholderia oklahomensis]
MRPVRAQVRFAMVVSSLATLLNVAFLLSLAWTVRQLVERPHVWPAWPVASAVLCLVGSYFMRLGAFSQSHYAAFRLEKILRSELADRLTRVSLGTLQQVGAGALSKVIHDDVKALHIFVADSTPLYARAFVGPACTLVVLLWLDWRLAAGAAAVMAIGFGVLTLAMRNAVEMSRLYNDARERVSAAVIEFVQAMPVVRTFDAGYSTFGRFQHALDAYLDVLTRWYRQAGFSARFSFAMLNPLPTLLVLLWLGAWLIARDASDFGAWVAVLLVGTGMAEAMMPMMMLNHMVDKAKLSVARIQQTLTLPTLPMPVDGRAPADASVTFENVGFSYGAPADAEPGTVPARRHDGHDDEVDGKGNGNAPVLRNVSFHVPQGSTTALVGPSGAGKTTVARLIPRFWDVDAGRVLVGGVDVRDMTADVLMSQLAFVFQDTFLFADTIANNIRLGSPNRTMDDVIAAAKAAQAHDFIMCLPNGYDTLAGERGAFLSGGQRQRITIARAILQNRPILVLDEATAFSDPENEAELMRALSALMRGKTVIMVAHRLSTIRHADQILVFDRGALVEAGRHDALLSTRGVYARLWDSHERAQHWALRGGAQENRTGIELERMR